MNQNNRFYCSTKEPFNSSFILQKHPQISANITFAIYTIFTILMAFAFIFYQNLQRIQVEYFYMKSTANNL
jgi:hypothetical protein